MPCHDFWPSDLDLAGCPSLKKLSWTMIFESVGLLIVAIYIWLPPGSYVVFSDNSGWYASKAEHRIGITLTVACWFVCPSVTLCFCWRHILRNTDFLSKLVLGRTYVVPANAKQNGQTDNVVLCLAGAQKIASKCFLVRKWCQLLIILVSRYCMIYDVKKHSLKQNCLSGDR